MAEHILAIDQGTTGTTCLVVRIDAGVASVVGRGYAEFEQHFPEPGWVEHDLNQIWASCMKSGPAALAAAGISGSEIAAIGITNQRETTGIWSSSGEPVSRAIVWQDRRTSAKCQTLREAGHLEKFQNRTGLVLDPYFSGTKVAWLLDHVDGLRARAQAGDVRFGTIDTWLVWKLTGGEVHITDATNASRTLLYDIRAGKWDEELCGILGDIPGSILPEVRSSSEVYGKTKGLDFLPDGIPIAGIAGDQQASLFGNACFEPGMAKCTYGTGAFALVNVGKTALASDNGLLTTVAWSLNGELTYALEGSVFIAGAIVQWLRDGLEFFSSSAEIEALAASVDDTGGVSLVPALTGLGAPHWNPDARGVICGLTRGTTRAHIARAALEGIALQVNDLLGAMRSDSGTQIASLRADGGAAANNLLMQFQADILGVDIQRPKVLDTTALGAAYLAALGVGIFSELCDVSQGWSLDQKFEPAMAQGEVERRVKIWREAVQKA